MPKVGWDLLAKDLVLHCTSSLGIAEDIVNEIAADAVMNGEQRVALMAKQPVYLIQHLLDSELINLSTV